MAAGRGINWNVRTRGQVRLTLFKIALFDALFNRPKFFALLGSESDLWVRQL